MSANLSEDLILERIIQREGGFVNHPLDRGGPTKYGITQRTLSEFRKRPVGVEEIRELSADEAREIYRAWYLRPFRLEPLEIREQVVDIAVLQGVGVAQQLLERARMQARRPVEQQLVIERLRHFARICVQRPTQVAFLEGWINRATSFL